MDSEKQIGSIKFYNEEKGYGFIRKEDGTDVFLHVTDLKERISTGDRVSFDEVGNYDAKKDKNKGTKAVNIKRI